ncbi:MAG: hypothetical protein KKB50_19290 [Planctomycetes bacterium]|nr:hypothetical protein [Planctomycetota bacterium]
MKTMTAKVTYSVDPLTVLEIQDLATAWGVPKSEVVRRAVHAAVQQRDKLARRPMTPTQALDELQEEPRLSAEETARWIRAVRKERQVRSRQ